MIQCGAGLRDTLTLNGTQVFTRAQMATVDNAPFEVFN